MKRVYFIRPIGYEGPIKIGCSWSPDSRRHSLETWSPFPLEIIAEIDGDHDTERRFHHLFLQTHKRREWFDWSDEMGAVVAQIRAGTFDTATLPSAIDVSKRIRGERTPRTEAQRRQFSISGRTYHLVRRTGYGPPVSTSHIVARGVAEDLAAVERYLKEPHLYGKPLPWNGSAEVRAAYHAKLQAAA